MNLPLAGRYADPDAAGPSTWRHSASERMRPASSGGRELPPAWDEGNRRMDGSRGRKRPSANNLKQRHGSFRPPPPPWLDLSLFGQAVSSADSTQEGSSTESSSSASRLPISAEVQDAFLAATAAFSTPSATSSLPHTTDITSPKRVIHPGPSRLRWKGPAGAHPPKEQGVVHPPPLGKHPYIRQAQGGRRGSRSTPRRSKGSSSLSVELQEEIECDIVLPPPPTTPLEKPDDHAEGMLVGGPPPIPPRPRAEEMRNVQAGGKGSSAWETIRGGEGIQRGLTFPLSGGELRRHSLPVFGGGAAGIDGMIRAGQEEWLSRNSGGPGWATEQVTPAEDAWAGPSAFALSRRRATETDLIDLGSATYFADCARLIAEAARNLPSHQVTGEASTSSLLPPSPSLASLTSFHLPRLLQGQSEGALNSGNHAPASDHLLQQEKALGLDPGAFTTTPGWDLTGQVSDNENQVVDLNGITGFNGFSYGSTKAASNGDIKSAPGQWTLDIGSGSDGRFTTTETQSQQLSPPPHVLPDTLTFHFGASSFCPTRSPPPVFRMPPPHTFPPAPPFKPAPPATLQRPILPLRRHSVFAEPRKGMTDPIILARLRRRGVGEPISAGRVAAEWKRAVESRERRRASVAVDGWGFGAGSFSSGRPG